MCGICGVVSLQLNIPVDQSVLKRMNDSIRHRGPDAEWIREHLDGRVNHSHRLWVLMMFEMWHHNEHIPC